MMIDRHTLTPIGILAVHFGSHDIAAAGDAVQKSSFRKFTQIGNDKRPAGQETEDRIMLSPRQLEAAFHGEKQTQTNR
jgi:hypothetical protein